jgi:raffinose/stachyose/melibiose transport system substrate-binding protein
MKKVNVLSAILAATLLVSVVATGCGTKAASNTATATTSSAPAKVSISLLNSKGEIATQLATVASDFNSSNKDGITLTVNSVSASSTIDETLLSKYAAGNPDTLNMVDPTDVATYASKSMDLSSQDWAKDISSTMVSAAQINGKTVDFPFAVEGDGLIYNQTTIEKATGTTFDPTSIKSLADLTALYAKIKAGGVTPVEISQDNWSLANHFLSTVFAANGDYNTYMSAVQAGTKDIGADSAFTNIMNLFDLNMANNVYKSSPLNSNYSTTDPANIANGKVAFWFNGTWVWPNVKNLLTGTHANDKLGFLPLFISDSTDTKISAGPTKDILVDNVKATPAQQKAANEFLNWLVTDPAGQKDYTDVLGVIAPYSTITTAPSDPLDQSLASYMAAGNTIPMVLTLNGDFYSKVGAFMDEYLDGKINRAAVAKGTDAYIASAK